MSDYTGAQTAAVIPVDRMPGHDESRELAQAAQRVYADCYGPRPVHIHVKAGTMQGRWHFSSRWDYYLGYVNNITVFYTDNRPQGWLHHADILLGLYPCGDGRCFAGDLNPMASFKP